MSKVKNNSSLPSGKDHRLVTVVREKWAAYQTQEKRFSKDFALALVNLHKQEAKPGYGKFVAHLRDLDIPTSTAYRLMRLHGWKAEKRTAKPPLKSEDRTRLDRSKAVVAAIHYLNEFTGEDLQAKFSEFVEDLRSELELSEAESEVA